MRSFLGIAQEAWYVIKQQCEQSTAETQFIQGPVVRITPTLLIINDSKKLPDIYHRQVNKSKMYISGSFGHTESVFNIQDWREHANRRRLIAAPVRCIV